MAGKRKSVGGQEKKKVGVYLAETSKSPRRVESKKAAAPAKRLVSKDNHDI